MGINTKEKVLFIATVYTHLAAFHKPFIQMLQKEGYEVHAAASSAEGRLEEIQEIGVICWEIPFARSPYSLGNVQAYRRLRTLLKEHYFDLIHIHTPVAAFLGRYLAKATNQGPVLYSAHGFHFYQGAPLRNWLIYYTAERLAAHWTDGLIVMNEEDFNAGKKLKFIPDKNLFYVHGVGVDLNLYSNNKPKTSLRQELQLLQDKVVITCIAELIPRKNHIFLLEAWKILANKYDNINLILVGDGKLKSNLESKVKTEKIPRIYFLGFRNDVPLIIQDSDIITLLSKHEGLPRCIMEAMACGKPVVATDVRGSRDLVRHNKTGLLVSLNNISELIEAFEKLISNKSLREQMGQAGREAIEAYSLDNVLKEMEKIYRQYL
ncbi:glycosyltransferase family 4 protein [Zhaonella formicivorans]|uniref:glycosyltransferase family 4 protein n=1 Tax=Zhaonella formicivorans TaxID=2528593 RepID=UPI0010DCC251|nr:glycosyltransferase family 4 protein [Zhaonella formicivorans]